MTQQSASHSLHAVAPVITEFCLRVLTKESLHQMGSVKVAAGFAGNKEITHGNFYITDFKMSTRPVAVTSSCVGVTAT